MRAGRHFGAKFEACGQFAALDFMDGLWLFFAGATYFGQ